MPKHTVKTKFYRFRQNNSGGYFYRSEDVNVSVYIEAKDSDEANKIAESVGLYFDGYGDCRCCGNRWYESWEDGTDEPLGKEISLKVAIEDNGLEDYCCVVHYYNGTKKYFKDS